MRLRKFSSSVRLVETRPKALRKATTSWRDRDSASGGLKRIFSAVPTPGNTEAASAGTTEDDNDKKYFLNFVLKN